MKAEHVAHLIESLIASLDEGLTKSSKVELASLAEILRRFESQTVKQFVTFVDKTLRKERDSLPMLISRTKAILSGEGESIEEIAASINRASAGDLKNLLKAFDEKPLGKMAENKEKLLSMIKTSNGNSNEGSEPAKDDVEEALRLYEAIEKNLDQLSVPEIRQRFESVGKKSKSVLRAVATKLGYSGDKNKDDLSRLLLALLERQKVSAEQTSSI